MYVCTCVRTCPSIRYNSTDLLALHAVNTQFWRRLTYMYAGVYIYIYKNLCRNISFFNFHVCIYVIEKYDTANTQFWRRLTYMTTGEYIYTWINLCVYISFFNFHVCIYVQKKYDAANTQFWRRLTCMYTGAYIYINKFVCIYLVFSFSSVYLCYKKIRYTITDLPAIHGEVGGWGRDPFWRNFMKPTPRRKWYLTTGRRFH